MNHRSNEATGAPADRADRAQRSTLVASCVCAILAGGPAAALELGEPVVRSALGQPLEVVVPYATWGNERLTADCVSLVRGDAGGLPAVTAGRVTSTAGNRLVIRSDRGIREPLLGLNLKVDCPATPFIIRSYTLIIDPPGLAPVAQTPAPLPAPSREPAEPTAVLPSAPAGARASRASAPAPAEPLAQGTEYRVRVGDTLSTIAQRVTERPDNIWTTAERIFAANPQAFVDGDMDRLRAGSVLRIPELGSTPGRMASEAPPYPAASTVRTPAATAANAPSAPSAPSDIAPATASVTDATPAASPNRSADRIRPAVRQAMDEMAAGASAGTAAGGDSAEPPSPFKAEAAADGAGELTPAGPAPGLPAADPEPRSSISPLFAALFGAGIGLLLGLVIFRSSLREFFRRAPTPAAGRATAAASGPAAAASAGAGVAASSDDTDVMAAPVFEPEEPDVIVSEGDWDDVTQSKLKSLDLDFGDEDETDMGEEVITEQQLAVARMSFPESDDAETLSPTDGAAVLAPEDRIDESMIMEVDTGAELAAGTDSREESGARTEATEDTGTLATVADLEMLEEDYEQEFTATQRLAKQLADAAIALDQEISAHGDDIDESIEAATEDTMAGTAQLTNAATDETAAATAVLDRDGDIIDEADQTAVLSADDATVETPAGREDEGDTVEHTGVYAAATTELPSAEAPFVDDLFDEVVDDEMEDEDDQSARETSVLPLSEKRRA